MNDEISIVLKAKDEASNVIEDMGKKTKASFADIGKQVSTAMVIAGGAITAFMGSTIEGASDAEKANKMLENAVINVSKATREQLDATSALADELERKGVLDGDNIKVGLAQLSTFGLSNDAVRGLGKSLADLAVNQFGVNASGEQLEQTANTVAKALNGQFGVLEKSGIRFTEAQKAIIQTGTEMEKVKAINEGLAQNLKFTNDTAITTFEGGMAKTKVQIDNVKEAIGTALMPILQDLATKLMPIIQNIQDWIVKNPELFEQIVKLVGVGGLILTVVGALGLVLPSIIAGFTILISPIGLVVVGLIALGVVIGMVAQNWDAFKNKTTEVWNNITSYLNSVWNNITSSVIGAMTSVKNFFVSIWEAIKSTTISIWSEITTFLTGVWNGIKEISSSIWGAFVVVITGIWEGLKNTIVFIAQLIAGLVIVVFQAFGIDIVSVFKNIFLSLQASWNALVNFFEVSLKLISQIWNTVWGAITETTKFLFDGLKAYFDIYWEGIKTTFTLALNFISKTWTTVWTTIKNFVAPIFKTINDAISAGWLFIKSIFETASVPVSNAWTNMWTGLGNIVSNVWEGVKNTVKASINWILEKVNTVINAINSVVSKGAGAFGGTAHLLNTIPLLANGGIISRPTLAMVGEGNEPEAVMPLSRLREFAGTGGGGITVNINGGYYLSEDVARDLGGKIIDMLKLNRKL